LLYSSFAFLCSLAFSFAFVSSCISYHHVSYCILSFILIVPRLTLCSCWGCYGYTWCAFGLGSFWSIDACYELSLFFKL
jgi:hypothetical protein